MTQEEERLIIIDICARVPYGLVVQQSPRYPICRKKSHEADYDYITHDYEIFNCDIHGKLAWQPFKGDDDKYIYVHDKEKGQTCKPYLRPMSSMTDEEWDEYNHLKMHDWVLEDENATFINAGTITDWLNEHHFDYRGLIEKGLAIEAPEKMYS